VLVLIIIAIIKFQGRRPSQALEPKAITGLRLAAIETAAWGAVGSRPARSRPARGQFLARSRPSASGNSRNQVAAGIPPRRARVRFRFRKTV